MKESKIFFIHVGCPDYLQRSIKLAQKTNPNSEIILIGTENKLGKKISFYPIEDFISSANSFASVFENMSSNPSAFELLCFQRWFILQEFLSKKEIKAAFALIDSDVLLFSDLLLFFSKHKKSETRMSICKGYTPPYTIFQDLQMLTDFCDFVLRSYTIQEMKAGLVQWYHDRFVLTGKEGGVCDMTLLGQFCAQRGSEVFEMFFLVEDSYYSASYYEIEEELVSLGFPNVDYNSFTSFRWRGYRPYLVDRESGTRIYFNAIHFQGGAKQLIPYFYRRSRFGFFRYRSMLRSAFGQIRWK